MQDHLHFLIDFLHANPHWGWALAFFIAFIESLAVIGTIIPGSITLTAIGALIGARVLPASSTIICAVLGAILGDYLSYWIGVRYKEQLTKIWPFKKYPQWLITGETFIKRHGGKSIFIGRFVGPMRSLLPLVAGILNMTRSRFIFAAIPSASLWALLYMAPGILIGALTVELPPKIAAQFVIVCLAGFVILWLIMWLIRHFFKQTWQIIDKISARIWNYFERHSYLHWINTMLRDHHFPELHGQLTILFAALIFGLLFVMTLISVATQNVFTHFNQPLHHLLTSIRNHPLDNIMLCFTLLGNKVVMLSAAVLMTLWLVWQKHRRTALHLLIISMLSAGIIEIVKHLVHSVRPTGLLNVPSGYSFPSGHTAITLVVLGFLATLIARDLKFERRWIPYFVVGCITLLVALSRIYMGAHWLTDVLGSTFLGLTLVMIITIAYRRKPIPVISAIKFIPAVVIAIIVPWLIFGYTHFQQERIDYTPFWPTQSITLKAWWDNETSNNLPLYRSNRMGKPIQALNIEVYGSLPILKQTLIQAGWVDHQPGLNIREALHQLSNKSNERNLPLLPMLYLNKSPVLLMTKKINLDPNDDTNLIVVLWASNIQITDTGAPLWIGSLEYYNLEKTAQKNKHVFTGALDELPKHLLGFSQKRIKVTQQPANMQELNWDSEIVLIRQNSSNK